MKSNLRYVFTKHLFLSFLAIITTNISFSQTWTGVVTDIRTGETLSGITVCGGFKGRKDATPKVITPASGEFSVTYRHRVERDYYVLHADSEDYLPYREYRRTVGFANVKLVPIIAHIKGRIVDADTGRPLDGINVVAGLPGRYLVSGRDGYTPGTTNANGEFHIKIPAYRKGNASIVIGAGGIPEPDQTNALNNAHEVITDYWIEANYRPGDGTGKNYERLATRHRDSETNEWIQTPVPLLSSVKSNIYSSVDFRLPAKTSNIFPSLDLVTVNGPNKDTGQPSGDNSCNELLERVQHLINLTEKLNREVNELKRELDRSLK